MNAEMTPDGKIVLRAETSLEVWALAAWSDQAYVFQDDIRLAEKGHWRGSKLIIDTSEPEA